MGEILKGKGKIVEVACQPGSASTIARELGFEDKIKQAYPGIKIVDKRYGMAEVAKSMAVAENMLTAFPDLDGMFGSERSRVPWCAARALTSAKSKVKLVGFDSSPTLIEGLKDGVIDSLVTQNPFDMGYKVVKAAVSKLNGGTVDHIQNLPAVVVTKANLDEPAIQRAALPGHRSVSEIASAGVARRNRHYRRGETPSSFSAARPRWLTLSFCSARTSAKVAPNGG